MRRKVSAGNYKLNLEIEGAVALAKDLVRDIGHIENIDIVIAPVFPALYEVHKIIQDSHIQLGAQNLYPEDRGAYTGEVSAPALVEAGVSFVIIGHSERRQYFKETNAFLNKKVRYALSRGLVPIYCIGETLEEREEGQLETVLNDQLVYGLEGIDEEDLRRLIIAYEPVWAIGTGRTATPEDAEQAHRFIRNKIKEMAGQVADEIRILYGGSVKPENIDGLMAMPNIDGALIGGASLKRESFVSITRRIAQ